VTDINLILKHAHLQLDYQDFYQDDTSELFSCMPYESATKTINIDH